MAIELMLSIQQFGGETWKHELPHRLVDWLDYVKSLEEKALVFNGIVCSAIAGESPAAIDRVRERDDFVQLTDAFGFQEDRIESSRNIVPRWTWSKLRVYLDRLRAADADGNCTTDRTGSPQTLVITKTNGSYHKKLRVYHEDQQKLMATIEAKKGLCPTN